MLYILPEYLSKDPILLCTMLSNFRFWATSGNTNRRNVSVIFENTRGNRQTWQNIMNPFELNTVNTALLLTNKAEYSYE